MNQSTIRTFPFIALLFFGSGLTALVYENVWTRQMQNFFGAATYSVSAVLCNFFIGMALGSFLFGKWRGKIHALRQYGYMELCVGLYALCTPFLFDQMHHTYLGIFPFGADLWGFRNGVKLVFSFFVFVFPCTLMGGTLAVLSRAVSKSEEAQQGRIGFLYAINTFGACFGTLLAGFVLIPKWGLSAAVRASGLFNLLIGIAAILLAKNDAPSYSDISEKMKIKGPLPKRAAEEGRNAGFSPKIFLLMYAMIGFCAIALEILWNRILFQTLTNTTYAFSTVLCLFLLGIAAGSFVSSRWILHKKNMPVRFAWFCAMLSAWVLSSLGLAFSLPFVYQRLFNAWAQKGFIGETAATAFCASLLVLPAAWIFGMLFPVALSWEKVRKEEIGAWVGKIYGANTLGGVLGSLASGFLMVSLFGTAASLRIIGYGLLIMAFWILWQRPSQPRARFLVLFFAACLGAADFYLFSRFEAADNTPKAFTLLFQKEDAVANVRVLQRTVPGMEVKMLKIDSDATSLAPDARHQRLIGHFPMLLADQPGYVLMIGLGTGVPLFAASQHGEKVECVEIVPSVKDALDCFAQENGNVSNNPKVKIKIDDGRTYLSTTSLFYDVIIGDLFPARHAGTGNLYATEHLMACKNHLAASGVMVQWLRPNHHLFDGDFQSVIKSFTTVFPFVELWLFDSFDSQKPLAALVASHAPLRLSVQKLILRIQSRKNESLHELGIADPYFLMSCCVMQNEELRKFVQDAPLNTYDHPRIEFSSPKNRSRMVDFMKIRASSMDIRFEAFSEIEEQRLSLYRNASRQNLMARWAMSKGNLGQAEMILQETINSLPEHPDTRYLLGQAKAGLAAILLRQGDKSGALQKLDSAEILGNRSPWVQRLKNLAREKK